MTRRLCTLSIWLGIITLCGQLVKAQCVDADCDPPPGEGLTNGTTTSIYVDWGNGGCVVGVQVMHRVCNGRCEIYFDEITVSDCCDPAFAAASVQQIVADIRNSLMFSTYAQHLSCNNKVRIVYPACWEKNNILGRAAGCGTTECCYVEGPRNGLPGPVMQLNGPATCTPPCINLCP